MTRPDDHLPEMPAPLDDDAVDRLLDGHFMPSDAPAGYAEIAALVQAAKQPPSRAERAVPLPPVLFGIGVATGAAARGATATRATAKGASVTSLAGRRTRRIVGTKVAAIVVVTALGATAAAAGTGNLPAPVQRIVARASESVGVAIPTPEDKDARQHPQAVPGVPDTTSKRHGTSGSSSSGRPTTTLPAVTGAGLAGLCTAFFAGDDGVNSTRYDSTAFRALLLAAGTSASAPRATQIEVVAAFCKQQVGVTPPTPGPGTTETATTSPETGKPETSKPETSKPETTKPETTKPAPPSSRPPATSATPTTRPKPTPPTGPRRTTTTTTTAATATTTVVTTATTAAASGQGGSGGQGSQGKPAGQGSTSKAGGSRAPGTTGGG